LNVVDVDRDEVVCNGSEVGIINGDGKAAGGGDGPTVGANCRGSYDTYAMRGTSRR
jgi:hypothetical protein